MYELKPIENIQTKFTCYRKQNTVSSYKKSMTHREQSNMHIQETNLKPNIHIVKSIGSSK